ncbi:sodium:solute symporter family protein [Acaryochloris sp. 'Moss Beach']|uniref:sodium:solute symporter family protein n=1 Tax=Acaryochloris sp. 'Moss Beach' TaxID=2740837 RepID=UPI001F1E985B
MADTLLPGGIIAFLIATLGIGVYASKQIKGDSVNFLVAGRGLTLPLAAATLMAQSVDSNATLGNTDLASEFGFWAGASLPLGLALCLFLTALFFAKPMNRMGLITLPDFYRVKYGRTTEWVAAVLMVVSFSFLLAGNLVAGGYLFQTFLGMSYTIGVILLAVIVLIYTASGGLFAVAYTDAIQVLIALVGSLCLLGYIRLNFGFSIPAGTGPFALEQMTSPAAGSLVNWATLLALGLGDIVAIDFMARIFSAESPETAQRACLIGSLGTVIIGVPFSIIALSAPEILATAGVTAEGPILYALLQNVVPSFLALLVIVAILSASLSTADGAILGTSSVIAHNILGIRHDQHNGSGDRLLALTRSMAVVITAMGVFFALKVPQTGVLLLLAFDLGVCRAAGPFGRGGLFYPKATKEGALACIIVGSLTRLLLFALMPVTFGIKNTLVYIPNSIFYCRF